jgi:hypothetical protein
MEQPMKLGLEVEYEWTPVVCGDGSPYAYPKPVRNVRESFHGPAVYRWRFMDGDTLEAVYFGECDDLQKEMNASVNPQGGKSGGRVKAALGERMLMGQAGVVDVVKVTSISIGGSKPAGNPLRDRHIRKAIESLIIHEAEQGDAELLNRETSARDLLSLL